MGQGNWAAKPYLADASDFRDIVHEHVFNAVTQRDGGRRAANAGASHAQGNDTGFWVIAPTQKTAKQRKKHSRGGRQRRQAEADRGRPSGTRVYRV